MRILFLSRYVDHIVFAFLRELSRHLDALHVVVERDSALTAYLREDGLTVTRLEARSRFDGHWRRALGKACGTDWTLVHNFHGNHQLANLIQWREGRQLPLIGYRAYIGHLALWRNPEALFGVRNARVDAVVAVSRAVESYLREFRWLRPKHIRTINHGVDPDWIAGHFTGSDRLRHDLGIPEDALVVASMANLRRMKGFDLLIGAAREFAGRVHFVHIGETGRWGRAAAGLPNVHLLGTVRPPFDVIRQADVFVSTSHGEALGRSNLEAMACGKPLIGAASGGLPDLIEPGVTGRLFRSGDGADFERQLRHYLDTPAACSREGEATARRVRQHFSPQRMAADYLALYRDVAAGRLR